MDSREPIVARFYRLAIESSSYEEFFLKCKSDEYLAELESEGWKNAKPTPGIYRMLMSFKKDSFKKNIEGA